jgi:hypothetical protein
VRRNRVFALTVAVSVACAGGAWGVLSTQTGCQLQGSCDADMVYVPSFPPGVTSAPYVTAQPFQADAGIFHTSIGDLWETSPIDGQWMDFPGQRTFLIYPQLPDGGPFLGPYTFPDIEVSADPSPEANAASNFAPSAGNIAEISVLPDGGLNGFQVTNDTCSPYFLWMQVAQENAGAPNAGADAAADASADGGADGGS